MADYFSDFSWHSSIGIDGSIQGQKKFYTKLPNTKKARELFITASDSSLLIHKATQALWKISDDGNAIVPVFDTDILTEEDLKKLGD